MIVQELNVVYITFNLFIPSPNSSTKKYFHTSEHLEGVGHEVQFLHHLYIQVVSTSLTAIHVHFIYMAALFANIYHDPKPLTCLKISAFLIIRYFNIRYIWYLNISSISLLL
ncbi:hypothetical protein CHS0354_037433 [Potamilus streckersoni]|uniref:Uncharacterized protein n=1 Tax=Potamilus streckersoni TaxID=2493646 RepID=A0AAE0RS16_9BIVA|nr:hypothetical protein CHS0354_037433 [Potamilus streckersoni]